MHKESADKLDDPRSASYLQCQLCTHVEGSDRSEAMVSHCISRHQRVTNKL